MLLDKRVERVELLAVSVSLRWSKTLTLKKMSHLPRWYCLLNFLPIDTVFNDHDHISRPRQRHTVLTEKLYVLI